MMRKVLCVSKGGYYRWLKNPIGKRKAQKEKLQKTIRETFIECRYLYGSVRVCAEINSNPLNEKISRTTVAKYMNTLGLKSKLKTRFITTTDSNHKDR